MSATFAYPVGTPTTELELPGPALGDATIHQHKVKLHLSMAGTIVTTKRLPTAADRLLLTFENLTITEYTSLATFISTANGRLFRYIGPQGTWSCSALNNPIERAAPILGRYAVTLELVGQRLQTGQLLRLQSDTGYLQLQTGSYLLLQEVH